MAGYSIGTNNRLLSDGVHNYTYDDEGNRLTKTKISTGEKEEYTWDHRNRLTKVTFKNAAGTVVKTVDLVYDVFDRWTRNTVDPDGATGSAAVIDEIFAYDGLNFLFEFDGPNAADLTHRYLWNPAAVDQLMADEAVTSLGSAGAVQWPLGDHLGTLRDLATYHSGTQTTTIANHRRYDSFGKLISETNSAIDQRHGYTGRPFNESTGLQDNWHRPYDPQTGNWPSQDPIGIGGGDPNFQRYVGNQPTTFVDPSGLEGEVLNPSTTLPKVQVLDVKVFDRKLGRAATEREFEMLHEESKRDLIDAAKGQYTTQFPEMIGKLREPLGFASVAYYIKAAAVYNKETNSCDYTGSKVVIQPYIVLFHDMKQGSESLIGVRGFVLDGPKSIREHELWHINGLPKEVLEKIPAAARESSSIPPGIITGSVATVNRSIEVRNSKDYLTRVMSVKNNDKSAVCDYLLKQLQEAKFGNIGGEWHLETARKGVQYELNLGAVSLVRRFRRRFVGDVGESGGEFGSGSDYKSGRQQHTRHSRGR